MPAHIFQDDIEMVDTNDQNIKLVDHNEIESEWLIVANEDERKGSLEGVEIIFDHTSGESNVIECLIDFDDYF